MNSTVVVLFAMEFVSLMLAVVLLTAWNSFGRPKHALTWCAAFAIAAVGWAGNILLASPGAGDGIIAFGVSLLSMTTWGVMLVGFRQRKHLATGGWIVAAVVAAPLTLLGCATLLDHRGLMDGIPPLFAATMLALSAGTMMANAGRGAAERAVIAMLLAFAMLDMIAGGIALRQGASGDPAELALFRALMMLTMPSAFTGTGLFAVFLLAADLADRMGRLAASDPLTGILNRRGFEEAAARAVANARRQGQPLTIVMADLDRFKSINDRYGHGAGDLVLCRFVEHVIGSIRAGDLFGRIGGEEFAMLLVDAAPAAAFAAIDRIRAATGLLEVPAGAGGGTIRFTASFGVTGPIDPREELPTMLSRADQALYQSKTAGRDRVTLLPPPVEAVASFAAARPAALGELHLVSETAAR